MLVLRRFREVLRSPDGRRDRRPVIVLVIIVIFAIYLTASPSSSDASAWLRLPNALHIGTKHPIDELIRLARLEHARLQQQPRQDVNEAAKEYRTRRGRHPPPGFDQWVSYAQEHNSPLREEYFDQIYEDLEPFWALNPNVIRRMAQSWDTFISIRNGHASRKNGSINYHWEWTGLWLEALGKIEEFLPDVDMPLNEKDEPRIITPWEEMNGHMQIALATRHTRAPTAEHPILDEYASYPEPDFPSPGIYDWYNDDNTYWQKARNACHPDTQSRHSDTDPEDMKELPNFDEVKIDPYVKNYTSARSACDHSYLHKFHGMFIRPGTDLTYKKLFPMFSTCKIVGINNDILLPPAKYFTKDPLFSGGTEKSREIPWEGKKSMAKWRGSPSGGHSYEADWRYFHRLRLVAMMNASSVQASERLHYPSREGLSDKDRQLYESQTGLNFPLPDYKTYPLASLTTTPTSLGEWTKLVADAGFTHLLCHPWSPCEYLFPYYQETKGIPLPDMFQYKYLPDADGMSYSGRYRSFLESTSLPIKATIWSEWHDARLIPWYHFVPMDNTMKDWWGIMEYFAGYDPTVIFDPGDGRTMPDKRLFRPAHDSEAKDIAYQGMEWSKEALREEDMIVYIYRLILEYARICDSRREQLGWTADIA